MEMITTTTTVTAGSGSRGSLESDWRFAELIAATWMEPGLNARYSQNPEVVLAEFGIFLAEGERAPELPAAAELDLLVEQFDQLPDEAPAAAACHFCFSPGIVPGAPATEAAAA